MKILFVMPKFAPGGAEKSLLMLLHFLTQKENVEVNLLLFKKEGLFLEQIPEKVTIIDPEETLNIAYSKFSFKNISTPLGLLVSVIRPIATAMCYLFSNTRNQKTQLRWKYAYKKVIRKLPGKYDVACGYLDGESVYYVVDKVKADKKIGWNQNDYNGLSFNPIIDREYYDKLDSIVTLTEECNEILKNIFPQYVDKMFQIPPITTQEYINRCAIEYKPVEYQNYQGYNIVSVGRLVEQKGFDIAIDACKILKDSGLDFKWYIIGNGELFEKLSNAIEEKKLKDNVILLGEKGNPYPYIKGADLFVQPSRFEGKSVILNEAKMLCVPILATKYPTVVDQIDNMKNGVIVELDAKSLAAGVINILNDRELQSHITNTLKNTDFSDDVVKEKYSKLFGLTRNV